jgi:DNA-binding response OmpR family regulator
VNKLIMVVDDDTTTLQLLGFRFRQQGRAVLKVSSGEGALSLIRAVLPDLLIIDLYMPGISGIDLCYRVRGLQQTETTPIIVYSSTSDENLIKRVEGIPDASFIQKASPLDKLLAEVEVLLKKMIPEPAET